MQTREAVHQQVRYSLPFKHCCVSRCGIFSAFHCSAIKRDHLSRIHSVAVEIIAPRCHDAAANFFGNLPPKINEQIRTERVRRQHQ